MNPTMEQLYQELLALGWEKRNPATYFLYKTYELSDDYMGQPSWFGGGSRDVVIPFMLNEDGAMQSALANVNADKLIIVIGIIESFRGEQAASMVTPFISSLVAADKDENYIAKGTETGLVS